MCFDCSHRYIIVACYCSVDFLSQSTRVKDIWEYEFYITLSVKFILILTGYACKHATRLGNDQRYLYVFRTLPRCHKIYLKGHEMINVEKYFKFVFLCRLFSKLSSFFGGKKLNSFTFSETIFVGTALHLRVTCQEHTNITTITLLRNTFLNSPNSYV